MSWWLPAALLWNLPNTAAGLVLGFAAGGGMPVRVGDTLEFRIHRGPVRWVCAGLNIAAFTVGDCVLYRLPPTAAVRVHERRHVTQYRVLGPLFLPVYFVLLAAFGYWNHPLERDARRVESDFACAADSDAHGNQA